MAEFVSTRGQAEQADARQAVLRGIAPDGGLYVPARFEPLRAEDTLNLDYTQIARRVLGGMLPSFSAQDIKESCETAYKGHFEARDVCELVKVGDGYALELFHGETAAFKDIALAILPRLLARARRAVGESDKLLILTATSGDTGSAAMNGFRGVSGMGILAFYPKGGVSEIQWRQMACMPGANVCACALSGNFDDCQTAVKRAFAELKPPDGIRLSSANSINIARLIPQITYYYASYARLAREHGLKPGAEVDYIVPTGNFGDILAGYYAKLMGLPVGRLICASNSNRVLTDFIYTGVYDRRREFAQTLSPSMDILISSNLERLLYHAEGCDGARVRECMRALGENGCYMATDKAMRRIREVFSAYSYDDAATLKSMRDTYREWGYLPDPHTAVGFAAMRDYAREHPGRVMVVLATASPYKFPESGLRALGMPAPKGAFDMVNALAERIGAPVPRCIERLKRASVCFRDETDAGSIMDYILGKAENICQA